MQPRTGVLPVWLNMNCVPHCNGQAGCLSYETTRRLVIYGQQQETQLVISVGCQPEKFLKVSKLEVDNSDWSRHCNKYLLMRIPLVSESSINSRFRAQLIQATDAIAIIYYRLLFLPHWGFGFCQWFNGDWMVYLNRVSFLKHHVLTMF